MLGLAKLAGVNFSPARAVECVNEAELADPVAIAEGLRRYLLKQAIYIRPDENIVDRYRFSKCAYPSDYYTRSGHSQTNQAWQACCHASLPNDLYYWGWTHLALDYAYILKNGLNGYIKRIEDAKNKFADLPDRLALLEGMLISLKAVSARNLLYAKAYEQLADRAENKADRAHYLLALLKAAFILHFLILFSPLKYFTASPEKAAYTPSGRRR